MTYTEDDPDWQAVVTPRTPSTAAGRRLVADATDHPIWASAMPGYVLAIEAEARASQAEYDFVSGPGIPPHQCAPLDVERLDIRWLLDHSSPMHFVGCGIGPCVCGVEAQYDAIIDRQADREYAALEEPTDD